MSYALEKLGTIYYKLAVGEGDVKQRLCDVQIELLCVTKPDLQTDLQAEWEGILNTLTRRGPIKDVKGQNMIGAIPNTLRGMRKETASKIAKRLIELYYKVKSSNNERI